MEDPRNLDAWIQLAFLAPDLEKSTSVLLNAEAQGWLVLQRRRDFAHWIHLAAR